MDRKDNGGINFLNISSAWAIFPQNIILLRFQNLVPPNQKFIQIACSYNQLQKYLRHFTPVHVAYFGWTDLPIILCLWSPPTPIKVASNIEACSRLEGTTLIGRKEGGEYFISQTWNHQQFNPRTYTQIHTPTKVQKGGGLIESLPAVFDMLQYFEMILPLVESLNDLLNKMRYNYFMGGGTDGGLWRHQQWLSSWPLSWILPRIRNQVKTVRNSNVLCFTWKITHKI